MVSYTIVMTHNGTHPEFHNVPEIITFTNLEWDCVQSEFVYEKLITLPDQYLIPSTISVKAEEEVTNSLAEVGSQIDTMSHLQMYLHKTAKFKRGGSGLKSDTACV